MASFSEPPDRGKIYKICSQTVWAAIRTLDAWTGSPDDLRDGFIHFSASHQLPGTIHKHFSGQSSLVVISIDANRLGDQLRWEPSRDGDLFPHLYAPMPLTAVIETRDLVMSDDGLIEGVDAGE